VIAYLFVAAALPAAAGPASAPAPDIVDAAEWVPGLVVRLAYATQDNFMGENVYGDRRRCELHRDAARMLAQAQEWLQRRQPGTRLLAYDCLRPRRVQLRMWERVKGTPQANYVANPHTRTGSIHNYGCAIDVSLADADGQPLDMGTGYDHFGPLAHPRHEARFRAEGRLSSAALANRLLLREVMVRAGFLPISNEWWHFNCATPRQTRARYRIVP
jgi:D-alanyl-D-alanine dipeptidase